MSSGWNFLQLAAAIAAAILVRGCSNDDAADRRRAVGPAPTVEALARIADPSRGERLFAQCAACHTIAHGAPDRAGPNLFNVVGAQVGGGSAGFGYTYALTAKGGHWTVPRLHQWLADPQRFAPGTQMLFAGVRDPVDRADLIAYLAAQSPRAEKR